MVINIKGQEVTLKYSFRSLIMYENIQNKSFDPKTTTDVLVFFFCIIISSAKGIDLTFDEFLDMIDDNPELLIDFTKFLTSEMDKNDMFMPGSDKKKVKKN